MTCLRASAAELPGEAWCPTEPGGVLANDQDLLWCFPAGSGLNNG